MDASSPVAFNKMSVLVRVEDQTLVQLKRQSAANSKFSHQLAMVDGHAAMERSIPIAMRRNIVIATGRPLRRGSLGRWQLEKQRLGTLTQFGNDLGFLAATALTNDNRSILLSTVGRGKAKPTARCSDEGTSLFERPSCSRIEPGSLPRDSVVC